jgi:hypothetical protein
MMTLYSSPGGQNKKNHTGKACDKHGRSEKFTSVGTSEINKPFGRQGHILEDNIKMNHTRIYGLDCTGSEQCTIVGLRVLKRREMSRPANDYQLLNTGPAT